MNDEGETFVISYPDGTMPDGISDLELLDVAASVFEMRQDYSD